MDFLNKRSVSCLPQYMPEINALLEKQGRLTVDLVRKHQEDEINEEDYQQYEAAVKGIRFALMEIIFTCVVYAQEESPLPADLIRLGIRDELNTVFLEDILGRESPDPGK
jgi:hypothetical protein